MQLQLLSSLILVSGASVSASTEEKRRTYLSSAVRNIGMTAIEEAHKKATKGRRLQDDDEFLSSVAPLMCLMFEIEDPDLQDVLDKSMESVGLVCPTMRCDDPTAAVPNLIIECSMDEETCDEEDPISGEKFCIAKTDLQMSMGLNFLGESTITSTQCSDYTSPSYMQDMGRGCFSSTMAMDYGTYMKDVMSGKLNIDMNTVQDTEKMTEIMLDYFEFDKFKCSGEFDDGTTCECGSCNEGKGFKFTCSNNLLSEECTDFDLAITDSLMQQDAGTSDSTPSVSIMRLLPSTTGMADDTKDVDDVAMKVEKEASGLRGAEGNN